MNKIIYGLMDFTLLLYFTGVFFLDQDEAQPRIDKALSRFSPDEVE